MAATSSSRDAVGAPATRRSRTCRRPLGWPRIPGPGDRAERHADQLLRRRPGERITRLDDGDEQSLRDVGERLGISAERVRQIERRALDKLAARLTHD